MPASAEESRALPAGRQVSEFMALPYLQGRYPAPEEVGVIRYNRGLSESGYNLYSSCHESYAALIDMKGNVLHEWSYDVKTLWPDGEKIDTTCWANVYLYPNGDLLAINDHLGLIKLDKDSNLLWSHTYKFHHDLDLDEKGNIYILAEDDVPLKDGIEMRDQSIMVLTPDGKSGGKLSFLKMMKESKNPVVEEFLKNVIGVALEGEEDVYHANTLEILDGSHADGSPAVFRKGNILISMLTIRAVAIIDPQLGDFVWIQGPSLWVKGQHHPTLLPDGNILTFDNQYQGKEEFSRVIEFEPFTRQIVWDYMDENFFSGTHGTVQRLANGNTLITESDKGRVIEVTPQKEIVWEFINPHRTGENNDLIATVLMMTRIDPQSVSSWLGK